MGETKLAMLVFGSAAGALRGEDAVRALAIRES